MCACSQERVEARFSNSTRIFTADGHFVSPAAGTIFRRRVAKTSRNRRGLPGKWQIFDLVLVGVGGSAAKNYCQDTLGQLN